MNRDVFYTLHSINKKMRKIADRELQQFGLTSTEMRLLNMIYFYDADGCTQHEFLSKIEIDRSNVGRSLKKLENLGYIRREKNEEDQRALRVFLTEKGWSIKDELIGIREKIKEIFAMDMSGKDFDVLTRLLQRADANLSEESSS